MSSEDAPKSTLKKNILRWGIGIVLPLVLIGLIFGLQKFMLSYPSAGEAYARGAFRVISFIPSKITNLIPISISEVLVVSGIFAAPFLIAWFIIRMVRAIKNRKGRRFFFTKARILAWGLCIFYLDFMLMHGLNYTRRPLNETLGFGEKTYTVEELAEVYVWVISELNQERAQCLENDKGVLIYPGGVNAFFNDAPKYYKEGAEKFPSLGGNIGRPKPVALSHYWSYTEIVGMYMAFLAECNVNKATTFTEIASSAFHEMTHLNGYAVENNANLASMLVRMNCSQHEIRYTAFYDALPLIEKDIVKAFNGKRDVLYQILDQVPLCDGFYRDNNAQVDFWETINPPKIVETVSNSVNDSFLKVNQQEEGVESYHMESSVVADYYFTYVRPKG